MEITAPRRRVVPEASYDEASRSRSRRRQQRPGRRDTGDFDRGMTVTRRGFIALFGVVAARLFYLQIVDGADLASAAESNRTNVATLHAKRGTIWALATASSR